MSIPDIDIKKALVEGKKEINKIYGVNSMSFIMGVTGKTATENNKLRTFSVLCGNSISCTPSYIQANIPWKLKKCMAKFRVGDHKLKIQTGRHYRPKIPLQERTCTLCHMNTVEEELHFLIICPTCKHLRDKLFPYDADTRAYF